MDAEDLSLSDFGVGSILLDQSENGRTEVWWGWNLSKKRFRKPNDQFQNN